MKLRYPCPTRGTATGALKRRYYDKTQIDASKGERWFCTEPRFVAPVLI